MRKRTRPLFLAVSFAVSVVALAGCTQREAPGFDPNAATATFSTAISPYTLVFQSRSYDSESNQTTFLYQLQNTNAPEPGPATGILGVFTNVFVEVPSCAGNLVSFSPPDGGNLGANINGIYGVEWGVGYDENPDFLYSVTFAGDVSEGTVRGLVTRGGQYFLQSLAGPCEGAFTVSGNVFTDANQDGVKGASDLGISDVTVKLSDGESSQTVKTDSDGNYVFTAGTGNYTLSVDSLTADADYNESLYQDWEPTTSQSRSVTVGPNSIGNNFGWEPDVDHIVSLIDSGELPTTGKSYKWWRKELLRAINGNHNTAYTPEELVDFIHTVEGYALLDEYNFTPGNELQEAYDILNNHAFGDDDGVSIQLTTKIQDQGRHDAFAFLLRELLTFELNHVSGRGPEDIQLRKILINWGEGLLKDNAPAPAGYIIGNPGDFPNTLTSPLEGGGTIFQKANGATGGGGTGG